MNKLNDVSDKFSKMLVSKNTMEEKPQNEKTLNKSKTVEVSHWIAFLFFY